MKFRIFLFPIIIAVLFYYSGTKLIQFAPHRRILGWTLSGVLFVLMLAWQFAYRAPQLSIDSTPFKFMAWAGSLSMGIWASFILYSLPIDLLHFGYWGMQKLSGPRELDPIRREFMTAWLPAGLLGLAGGSSAFGLWEVNSGPKIREIVIPIDNLPSDLEGLKIAQISDLHVGPTIRRAFVEQVVQRVLATQPDLIAVTGDLIDGTPQRLANHIEPLSRLSAPLGTFYVTGNHEYYWGAEDWVQTTTQLGFTPLLNENRILKVRESKILLAGVTDTGAHDFIAGHRSSPQLAAQTTHSCDLKILLAHRPESCLEGETVGFDLQLSGHTHAGQFFPWSLLVRLAHKYYRGLNRHGRMWVYVNAGTGYWGPAHRFLVPSEITLIRLTSNKQGNFNGTKSI